MAKKWLSKQTEKFSRRLKRYWPFLILLILVVLVGILFPQRAFLLSAVGTLTLAIIAYLAILNANLREGLRRQQESEQENRERKERLLDEIIAWAKSILTWRSRHKEIFRDVARSTSDSERIKLVHANIAQVLGDFAGITGLNEYMKEIALQLEQDLPETIEKLIYDIGTYLDCLEKRFYELTPNIKKGIFNETDKVISTTEALAEQMINSARYVLVSVAKIKTNNLGTKEENLAKEGEATVGKEPTLKDIEEHLKRQDKQMALGTYYSGYLFGAALIFIAFGLLAGKYILITELSYVTYSFIILVGGTGLMLLSWYKRRKLHK